VGGRRLARVGQESRRDVRAGGDQGRGYPVNSRRACSLVSLHPVPRHGEEVRVIHEVEQITKPTTGIIGRPLVQLGLHPPYPRPRLIQARPRFTSIHQRLQPLQCLTCTNPLGPFAMWPAFPTSDYYGPSAPPTVIGGRRAYPPCPAWPADPGREQRDGSHVHHEPLVEGGAQLCPCGLATATPQTFTVASRPATSTGPGVPRPLRGAGTRRQPAHIHRVRAGGFLLRGVTALIPRVHLLDSLAEPAPSGSADASRRCRGCFPPSPASPRSGCPLLHRTAATAQRWWSLTSTRFAAPRGARSHRSR
jgi:hypothetical protein